MGKVPYAAIIERELAVVRYRSGTRFGTEASFAGDQSMVNASRINEAITRPKIVSTKGKAIMTAARPKSQRTITFFRSQRSTNTPAIGPKKNPGAIRATSTRLNAAPSEPDPTRIARMLIASNPSQSPVAETT